MGVTLARLAASCAHVLLVEVPGQWRLRARTERAVLARGWVLAASPADADVLVVCGTASPRLAEAVEAVWNQLPGPRIRIGLAGADELPSSLDQA